MNIYDIEIHEIINQYINFINSMKEKNIIIASEYLVMASELLNLKSRMLLNQNVVTEEESDLSINSVEDLQNKLVQYEKYKKVTDDFKRLEEKRNEIFTKEPSTLNEYIDDEIKVNENTTVNDLLNAFALFLERQRLDKPINTRIIRKEYSVEKRSKDILNFLNSKKKVTFRELFDIESKDYIIVTFLSILELTKKEERCLLDERNYEYY